ncbi:hypothetical protein P3S68_023043 [Capsicum galapagoense]
MESNPSCTDVKHINEELPIKVDEKLKLNDKEEEYSDISLHQLNFNHVDDFMEWHADKKVSSSFDGWERCRGEIVYILGSKYWGKGIATKSTKLVRLESLVDVENTASQRGRV